MWHLNQFCRDIRTAGSADTPWPALPWDGLPAVSQARSCSSGNSRMCSQVFGEGAAAGPRLPCKRTACVHKAKGRMAQRHHERDASVGKAAVHTGHGCGHMLTPATRGPRRPPCSGRSLRLSSPASSLLRLGPRPLSRQLLRVICGSPVGYPLPLAGSTRPSLPGRLSSKLLPESCVSQKINHHSSSNLPGA